MYGLSINTVTGKINAIYNQFESLVNAVVPETKLQESFRALKLRLAHGANWQVKVIIPQFEDKEEGFVGISKFLNIDISTNDLKNHLLKGVDYKCSSNTQLNQIIDYSITTDTKIKYLNIIDENFFDFTILFYSNNNEEEKQFFQSCISNQQDNILAICLNGSIIDLETKKTKNNPFILDDIKLDEFLSSEKNIHKLIFEQKNIFQLARGRKSIERLQLFTKSIKHIYQQKYQFASSKNILIKSESLSISHNSQLGNLSSNNVRDIIQRQLYRVKSSLETVRSKKVNDPQKGILKRLNNHVVDINDFDLEKEFDKERLYFSFETIQNLNNEIEVELRSLFNKDTKEVKKGLDQVKAELRHQMKEEKVNLDFLTTRNFKQTELDNILYHNPKVERENYEKEITSKGWKQLFFEIRQPLFIIMPLMMIFGYFSRIFGDFHPINVSIEEDVLVVSNLPNNDCEKYKKGIINLYISKTTELNQYFDSSISQEGRYKNKRIPKVNKRCDEGGVQNYVEIKLEENLSDTDKQDVLSKFKDTRNAGKFDAKKNPFGMTKNLAYRYRWFPYLVVTILLGLVGWLSYRTKLKFDAEKKNIVERSKIDLKRKLNVEVERIIKSASENKWKGILNDYLDDQIRLLNQSTNNAYNNFNEQLKSRVEEKKETIARRKDVATQELRRLDALRNHLSRGNTEIEKLYGQVLELKP